MRSSNRAVTVCRRSVTGVYTTLRTMSKTAIPTTTRLLNIPPDIPPDVPKLRQPARSAAPPSVPMHLTLADEDRQLLQSHLNLVGIDRYRFGHTTEEQSMCTKLPHGINFEPFAL